MKAIRKDDGKEIEVNLYSERSYIATKIEEGEKGKRYYHEDALIIKGVADWEAFRREAAKDILAGLAASGLGVNLDLDPAFAVKLADELIKQLKDGK